MLAAAVVMSLIWTSEPTDKGVIAEWNETIGRLGIEPVFPPEEDIYVGDLFAVITADKRPNSKDTRRQPLLNRAIKLTHIKMSDDLETYYQALPLFSETAKRPSSPEEPWVETPKPGGVFVGTRTRELLAITAFPGFAIRHGRTAAGGLSAWSAGLFGASQQDSDIIEVKIPFAETYGVPSLVASAKLADYCEKWREHANLQGRDT